MNAVDIAELAEAAGIEPGYTDTWGKYHEIRDDTRRALLTARGFALDDPEAIARSLAELRARGQPTIATASAPAWRPSAFAEGGRRWGIAVQLYALRSYSNWGIGDFADLQTLIEGAAALGAAAIGLNPLHALFPTRPAHASPYSPSSRLFLNPLYLAVEAIADFAECRRARRRLRASAFQARLGELRAAPQLRYREVAELKFPMLEEAYRHFRRHHLAAGNSLRATAFREFQRECGAALRRFATFHVLAESHDEFAWHRWPANERDPASEAVASFVVRHEERIEFHEYLQWQCDEQLRAAAANARAAGMSIGLYRDLAVGADANGAETWSTQRTIVAGVAVGAPPDQLNLDGQNWGFPPPDPLVWQAENYVSFRELLRANMRHAGAMRMDHVLGLVRLWWIPAGARVRDGAYQHYPWSELLAALAETSRQERCLVIGEDLGTVPQGLRETMHGNGILSCRLLYFERRGRDFAAPQEYPSEALVAATTHDLPTLAAWWQGDDIALRDRLGLWPDAGQRTDECKARAEDREALLRALREQGIADEEAPGEEAPIAAVHRFLARTPCRMLMVQLEDALGARTQLNVPGTTDEYPNWRLRLPCDLNEALSHPRMRQIAATMREEGRSDRET